MYTFIYLELWVNRIGSGEDELDEMYKCSFHASSSDSSEYYCDSPVEYDNYETVGMLLSNVFSFILWKNRFMSFVMLYCLKMSTFVVDSDREPVDWKY